MLRFQREQLPGQLKGAVAVDRERVEHLVAAEPDEHGALLAAVGAVRRFDLAGRREPERPPAHGRRLDDVEGRLSIDKSPILGTRSPLASAGGSCRPPPRYSEHYYVDVLAQGMFLSR